MKRKVKNKKNEERNKEEEEEERKEKKGKKRKERTKEERRELTTCLCLWRIAALPALLVLEKVMTSHSVLGPIYAPCKMHRRKILVLYERITTHNCIR